MQIPDDLTPPNETDALRLPDVDAAGATTAGECLEAPPSFFGESRPFRTSEDEGESRRERREARRQARANEAEQESEAPASEQSDAEPTENDRVIDN